MAVESPADLFFIGLNRLSIEAGLYARFLGYRVTILGNAITTELMMGESVDTSWTDCTTPLGRRALEAQGSHAEENVPVSVEALAQNYIRPLTESDLLADSLFESCTSVAVRLGESDLPDELDEDVEYDTRVFELTIERDGSTESMETTADVLVDLRTQNEMSSITLNCAFDPNDQRGNETLATRLMTGTPDFYQLEMPVNPSGDGFQYSEGINDIRDLFRVLCDSNTLDLYAD